MIQDEAATSQISVPIVFFCSFTAHAFTDKSVVGCFHLESLFYFF